MEPMAQMRVDEMLKRIRSLDALYTDRDSKLYQGSDKFYAMTHFALGGIQLFFLISPKGEVVEVAYDNVHIVDLKAIITVFKKAGRPDMANKVSQWMQTRS